MERYFYNNFIAALLAFLSGLDSYFVSHAYFTTLLKGASVQIVFGFEVRYFFYFFISGQALTHCRSVVFIYCRHN